MNFEDDIDTQIAKKLKDSNEQENEGGKMQLPAILKHSPVQNENKNKV